MRSLIIKGACFNPVVTATFADLMSACSHQALREAGTQRTSGLFFFPIKKHFLPSELERTQANGFSPSAFLFRKARNLSKLGQKILVRPEPEQLQARSCSSLSFHYRDCLHCLHTCGQEVRRHLGGSRGDAWQSGEMGALSGSNEGSHCDVSAATSETCVIIPCSWRSWLGFANLTHSSVCLILVFARLEDSEKAAKVGAVFHPYVRVCLC